MVKTETAITIWIDESTEIRLKNQEFNLIGYLITNSDKEEFDFLNSLKQARKAEQSCWVTLHGSELREDARKLNLLNRWIEVFKASDDVYFHVFLYRKNDSYISEDKTYEHYFAKQSIFSLAQKMKKKGYTINTMFKDVSTLTVLFDRRRAHAADVFTKNGKVSVERLNELEEVYRSEIEDQIKRISAKDSKSKDFTVRFSFLSSECFDAMQLSDCLLYLVRKKIEQEVDGIENTYTQIFDKYFLNDLDAHTKAVGFKKIYEYDKKFNYFESNK